MSRFRHFHDFVYHWNSLDLCAESTHTQKRDEGAKNSLTLSLVEFRLVYKCCAIFRPERRTQCQLQFDFELFMCLHSTHRERVQHPYSTTVIPMLGVCVYAFNSTCKLIHYWTEPNRTVRFLETANIEVLLFIQKLRTITIATMKWERIYTEPEIKSFEVKYVIELLLAYTRTKYWRHVLFKIKEWQYKCTEHYPKRRGSKR